ncbi:MAG: nitroreductase family protein [Pseudomonadales bacterium]|nr:nitroreductase family protein [Pseudomonadales bacterium]
MELYQAMRTTFAAREYTDASLSDELLYEILDNARFAPSGGNRQGARVIIVRDASTKEQLASLGKAAAQRYSAQKKAGENPWNTITPSKLSQAEIDATIPPTQLIDTVKGASVALVFVLDLSVVASMDQNLERIGVISGASIYPLVWNVLLAARQAGFGGTITTLAASCEPQIQQLLNIPKHFAVSAVVPLGKPVRQLTRLKRKPVSEFVSLETFDGKPFKGA